MNYRDYAERLFWTAASAALAALVVSVTGLTTWWAPVLTLVLNWASLWVRKHVAALPNPGDGLPFLRSGN